MVRTCTKEENAKLNATVRASIYIPESWDDAEWVVWAESKSGAAWYTVLDDCGLPSEDNIIEGAADGMDYRDLDDAMAEWGNCGLVSLDYGASFREVADLDDDEVKAAIDYIWAHDSAAWPEFAALRDDLARTDWESDREWLEAFMARICMPLCIG